MTNPIFNTYKKLLIFVFLSFNLFFAFGYDCSLLYSDVQTGEAPDPRAIVCVIGSAFTIFIGMGGLVLVYMVLWGAFKLSMSQGDPKGYIAAQNTWFYALLGFLVVVMFFGIYIIATQILGLPIPTFFNIQQRIEDAIAGFMTAAGIRF